MLLHVLPDTAPDPFDIDTTQYLINRLPGYMVRSVPGRLWARVSRKALAAGMSLATLGQALVVAYSNGFEEIAGVEVLFVTSATAEVEELAPIAAEATILAGRHKKLVLSPDGDVECADLDCDTCDEKPVCDNLRDVVIKRRRMKNERRGS